MLEVLILVLSLLGWICFMSLCARQNELKSEGRGMPRGTSTHDNHFKSSETGSAPSSCANESYHRFKRHFARQKRFGRDDAEKKVEERKTSDEKTEPKSSKKEKKEEKEKDAIKDVNKVIKEEIKAAKVDGRAKKAEGTAVKPDHAIEKTQLLEIKPAKSGTVDEAKTQMEFARPSSSRSTDINKDAARVPDETLALLAAAEQMADDKGDYYNFGPPEGRLEK